MRPGDGSVDEDTLVVKHKTLSSVLEPHMVEGESKSWNLFLDPPHERGGWQRHTHAHEHNYINVKEFKTKPPKE